MDKNEIKLSDLQVKELEILRNTHKFSNQDFTNRGLIPSDSSVNNKMNTLVNYCLNDLISTKGEYITTGDYKEILETGLNRFESSDYDTEEKEFIAERFIGIAKILNIHFEEETYGWANGNLALILSKLVKPKEEQILKTSKISCSKCENELEQLVTEEENDHSEYWVVVKCSKCSDLNLFSLAKNAKRVNYKNCGFIESYSKAELDSLSVKQKMEEFKNNISQQKL